MERVKRRDFIQYTSRYLNSDEIIVTNRGVDEYVIKRINADVATKIEKEPENVATKPVLSGIVATSKKEKLEEMKKLYGKFLKPEAKKAFEKAMEEQ